MKGLKARGVRLAAREALSAEGPSAGKPRELWEEPLELEPTVSEKPAAGKPAGRKTTPVISAKKSTAGKPAVKPKVKKSVAGKPEGKPTGSGLLKRAESLKKGVGNGKKKAK